MPSKCAKLELNNANQVLASWGGPPLERIAQLFQDLDANFLTTFKELDCYERRENIEYWGVWANPGGKPPVWPGATEGDSPIFTAGHHGAAVVSAQNRDSPRPREDGTVPMTGRGTWIFAYLKPFPALPRLLNILEQSQCPTLMYVDGMDTRLRAYDTRCTNIRFENERLDMDQIGQQCDLAILNGTHASTASMMLAGKPMLQLPLSPTGP